MTTFGTIMAFYIFFFLAIAAYVGINIYHLIKFRLGFRGDKTGAAIIIYLLVVLLILAVSWFGAFTFSQPISS
jgi:hypothetical protein